jgi:hypothetical protein
MIAGVLLIAAGCGGDDASETPEPEQGRTSHEQANETVVGPWHVAADVEPREIDVLEMSIASLRVNPEYVSNGREEFLHGRIAFSNTGDAAIELEPIDQSAFAEDDRSGDQLLLAEGQCGYGVRRPGAPVEPGVCTLALLPPTPIAPGATKHRRFAVYRGLSGMEQLEAGRYSFTRPVRFSSASPAEEGSAQGEPATIVIEVRRDGGQG